VGLRLTYLDNGFDGSTTAIGGYQTTHNFRGNNIYDPDETGVGVQPYGYDQWVALMGTTGNYNVMASSITINYTVDHATPVSEVRCYVIPYRHTTISYTDMSDLRMTKYCRWKVTDTTVGANRKNWVKNYMSTRRLFRETNPKDYDFASAFGGAPGIPWYWIVIFDTAVHGEAATIYYDCKIKYYVRMTRIQNMNES